MRRIKLFVMCAILIYATRADAGTFVVPDDCATIQKAINSASAGDAVRVKAGVYEESLTFKDGVDLAGEDRDTTKIRGDAKSGPVLTVKDCRKGKISGLTLEHTGGDNLEVEGKDRPQVIEMKNSSVEVTDCLVQNSARNGILIEGEGAPTIRQCLVRNNEWNGIVVLGSGCTPTLANNDCSDNAANGICFAEAAHGSAEGNTCARNLHCGIFVIDPGTAAKLTNNNCSENKVNGIYIRNGARGNAENNTCTKNVWHGISVYDENTMATLRDNQCSENAGNGIFFGSKARGSALGNKCVRNEAHGISIADRDTVVVLRNNSSLENAQCGIYYGDGARVTASANVISDNREISKGEIGRLLESEEFGKLEAMASRLRAEKTRYPSGEWQLGFFYDYVRDGSEKVGVSQRDQHIAVLERWSKTYPESVTPRIALANAHIHYAWVARGGDWAFRVDEKGWKGFHENLERAWEVLTDARGRGNKDPALYSALLTVGMGSGIPEGQMDTIFLEGVALEPAYYPLYYSRVVSLLPRWGGWPGGVEAFAARAAELTKEQEGEALYARVAAQVLYYVRTSAFDRDFSFSWPRIKQGHLDILEAFPNSNYRLNWFCMFATLFKDKETALELFGRIGDNRDRYVWPSEQHFQRCKNWARGEGNWPEPQTLHYAAARANVPATRRLLDSGEDVNARDEYGRTPLHVATEDGDVRLIQFLIESGADVNSVADDTSTPLYIAVQSNKPELASILLENGADVNASTHNGWCPLMRACKDGHVQLVRLLLHNGADVNQKMTEGWTALHLAASEGFTSVLDVLLGAEGIDINPITDQQRTPLYIAAEAGHEAFVGLLLSRGADATLRDIKDRTPLIIARRNGHKSIVQLLRKYGGDD